MNDNQNNSDFTDSEPERDFNYLRQDAGGMVTAHNGVADRLLKNNDLYRSMKGNWRKEGWNQSRNIKTTTGREDGKFFISREQMNTDAIAEECRAYRTAAEAGIPDPLGPLMPDGTLGYKWMNLPDVIAIRISDQYFNGMPWAVIKHDRTLKAQFYSVVQREYAKYICYPGGRLPIPFQVPYPRKSGERQFFKGI
jgi:hypothetical protein